MKRYSIPTKTKALNLIKTLGLEEKQTISNDINAIKVWGFEDKHIPVLDENGLQSFDKENKPLFELIKGLTYNVDVAWKGEQPTKWEQYEVNPSKPNHIVL